MIVEVETELVVCLHAAVPHADNEVRIRDRDGEHIRIVGCWFQLGRTYTVGFILSYAVKVGNSPGHRGNSAQSLPPPIEDPCETMPRIIPVSLRLHMDVELRAH